MATDEAPTGGSEHEPAADAQEELAEEEGPYYVEAWNDYDPSMRFVVIYPVGEKQGATASSASYTIIEPGKHSGLHSDNAEEVVFVAEGEGEVFMLGRTQRLEAGSFHVLPAGMDHDIYAYGSVALRLLSFFPTSEIVSTFQQVVFPVGTNTLSSKPAEMQMPAIQELDPNNLPEDFPFDLAELGMAPDEPRELTMTERLIGMTEPGVPPKELSVRVIDPKNPDVNLAEQQSGDGEGDGEAGETAGT